MIRAGLIGVLGAAALAAPAEAAVVQVMSVGRETVVRDARSVTLKGVAVRVGGRRCRVAGATPLAALVRTRVPVRLRDYGACGRNVRDAGGLYVSAVGGERARGRAGWVYKVGRRLPSLAAGDPLSRLRDGNRVLWFWCRPTSSGGCQRTLEVVPDARNVAPGTPLRVTVRGYDDRGRGVPVAGATVRLGEATATTGADGTATLPAAGGRLRAEHPDMVRSFPVSILTA